MFEVGEVLQSFEFWRKLVKVSILTIVRQLQPDARHKIKLFSSSFEEKFPNFTRKKIHDAQDDKSHQRIPDGKGS